MRRPAKPMPPPLQSQPGLSNLAESAAYLAKNRIEKLDESKTSFNKL